ncbi:MAG: phosphatase PAP2 family protein [Bryobacteraceae bacterium]
MSDSAWSSRPARQARWLLLAPVLVAISAASGQEPRDAGVQDSENTEALRPFARGFVKNILVDQKAIWTSPFHMTRKDAQWWLTFGAVVGVAVATDRRSSQQLPNTPDQRRFSRDLSQVGAAYTLIPILGGFYVSGVLAKSAKLRGTGLLGGEAVADALIVSEVLKFATGRQRPLEGDGGGHFLHGGGSFPSGHAIESFALASVIAHRWRHKKAVVIAAYGLATLVSASRFSGQKHFASDIVAGGVMGWFIGRHVCETH